jgi:uncharacterized protein (TIGR00725 family)
MRKLQICVVGSKTLDLNNEQDKNAWDFSYKLGFALGRTLNIAVLVSGSSGVAEAVAKGVNDSGGIAVNILQGNFKEESTDESHVKIASTKDGYDHCWPLIYSCDSLIAIGGGVETGIQISLAVDLGIHVIIYSKAGGISSEVFTSLEPAFQKMRSSQLVYLVENSEEAFERAKQFALDRLKKEQKIDVKKQLELPPELELVANRNKLEIIASLTSNKTQSAQEISNQLKIPLAIVQGYLEEMDSLEIVMAKKAVADEFLFSLNLENNFTKKLIDLITIVLDK